MIQIIKLQFLDIQSYLKDYVKDLNMTYKLKDFVTFCEGARHEVLGVEGLLEDSLS